jgi:thymidine kinase
MSSSYLEIILGPMFSGKTSRLVEIYKKNVYCNIEVIVINHMYDNRYDNEREENMLYTHDLIKIPCIKVNKLIEYWNDEKIKKADVILINEGQFFEDLYDTVNIMLNNNKKVYIAGLDGDYRCKKFGQILDLIPMCDKVEKLNSLCSICKNGNPGIFSLRITNEREQKVIGYSNYISVCRKCYKEENK